MAETLVAVIRDWLWSLGVPSSILPDRENWLVILIPELVNRKIDVEIVIGECVEVYHNDIQDGISPNSHIVEHTDLELAEPNFIDQFRDCLTRYGLTLRHSSEVELGAALAKYTNPTRT
jgi:hypothetical protein